MANQIKLPRTFSEWQAAGPQLAELERVINSLMNMQGHILLPDGNTLVGAVKMSGRNTVMAFQPGGNGGAPVLAVNPVTTAPPVLNQMGTASQTISAAITTQ